MMNKTFTIFYTDDDGDDRELFTAAAQDVSEHLEVSTQTNGNELLDQLHNPPPSPHVLFLDLNMPGKNGFEILKEIREAETTKDLPVIIFSTSDDEQAIAATRELGANMYITKPNSYSSLKKVIKHSLSIDWSNETPTTETFVVRI